MPNHDTSIYQFRKKVLISILNLAILVTSTSLCASFFLEIPEEGIIAAGICFVYFVVIRILILFISFHNCAVLFLGFVTITIPVNHYFTYPTGQGAVWWYTLLPLAYIFFFGKIAAVSSTLPVGILAGSMDLLLIHIWGQSGSKLISNIHISDAVFHAVSVFLCGGISYYFEKNREDYEISQNYARKLLEETIENKERIEHHLNETNKLGNIGGWSLEVESGEIWWSDQTYRIHELPVGSNINVNEAINFYAEEARPIISKAVQVAIDTGKGWDLELPFITNKGRNIWVRAVGASKLNSKGTPVLQGTFQDITDRKVSEQKLLIAKEEAVRAVVAKSQFLANMSHEIRTPMNGVLGNAELLLSEEQDPARKKRISMILQSGESMMQILNDILDFSKIERGQLAIDSHPFDLYEQLHSVYQLFDSNATEKGIALKLVIDDKIPKSVNTDSTRLRQILTNLISNAIKFTKTGTVSLRVKHLESKGSNHLVKFEVEDTGIGIKHGSVDQLFDEFTQADISTTRKYGGTGLGLAICQRLARLLGSEIKLKTNYGHGSIFYFVLELEASPIIKRQEDYQIPKQRSFHHLSVLVVEDHPINRDLAYNFLKTFSIECELAENGLKAVKMIKKKNFDIIFMDCQMPIMDGYDATKEIRKLKIDHQPTIIAMTAHAMASDEKKCKEAGMDDYMSKPISRSKLNMALSKWNNTTIPA